MKLKFSTFLAITGFCFSNASGQTHQLLLKPGSADGKDAYIHDLNVNENMATHRDYAAIAWTCNGPNCVARGLMDFDWSLIPQGAVITNAKLKLYINPSSGNGTSSGANVSWIERITSSWNETTVTWSNQPTVTATNRISIGPATGTTGNQEVNVTQLVNDIINNPQQGFGFRISLQSETTYKRLMFASSDHEDCTLHPELLVEYTIANPAAPVVNYLSIQPDASAGKDTYIHDLNPTQNLGNNNEFASVAWTCNGTPCIARSLIDFDLSSIPSNMEIVEATLFLSQNPTSTNGAHAGTNESVLKRITSAWDEQTVTWANAPTTTSFNQVTLSTSTSPTQNYAVNVTGLIQDYLDNPSSSFGMMISQITETTLRRMTFASSDHTNCALRPRLEIQYKQSSLSAPTYSKEKEVVNVYPNPTSGIFHIETIHDASYSIIDSKGRILLTGNTLKGNETVLDITTMEAGVYFLQLDFEGSQTVKKIVRQ